MKFNHYVPIIDTHLTFGFQISVGAIKAYPQELLNRDKVLQGKPKIRKYFFQFFVPDKIFHNERDPNTLEPCFYNVIPQNLYFSPPITAYEINTTPYKSSYEKTALKLSNAKEFYPKLVEKSLARYTGSIINANIQYGIPGYFAAIETSGFLYNNYESSCRLKKWVQKDLEFNKEEEIFEKFLRLSTPKLEQEKDLILNDLWLYYESISERGIELLIKNSSERPKIVAYAASLSGISILSNKRTIITYNEIEPQHNRIPLFMKVEELSQTYECLQSSLIKEIDAESWFKVLWSPMNCTPQLHASAQVEVAYKFHPQYGCERIGIHCYKLKGCKFWSEILKYKETADRINEEEQNFASIVYS